MKYYVVSDTHSFYTPLKKALTDAGYFSDTAPHKLIVCGDLFDRGSEAVPMQEFILDLLERDEVLLIRGNHEDLYEELATVDEGRMFSHHLSNGTYATALQLTGFDPALAMIQNYDFAEAARETPFYQTIIPATHDYYETEHFIFVHGWIPCAKERDGSYSTIENWREASEQEWRKARWYNGMAAARSVTVDDKTIICGHWHTSYGHSKLEGKGPEFGKGADFSPYTARGIVAIDGCTAHSGIVNCIVLED